jgi:hypothetical protein
MERSMMVRTQALRFHVVGVLLLVCSVIGCNSDDAPTKVPNQKTSLFDGTWLGAWSDRSGHTVLFRAQIQRNQVGSEPTVTGTIETADSLASFTGHIYWSSVLRQEEMDFPAFGWGWECCLVEGQSATGSAQGDPGTGRQTWLTLIRPAAGRTASSARRAGE